jgi:ABC-type nitrate/sulfonate/bicarbonate transport system permease component
MSSAAHPASLGLAADGLPPQFVDLTTARPDARGPWWWRTAVVAEVLLVLGAWEVASGGGVIPANFLPPPSEIGASIVELFGLPNFWSNLQYTLTNLGVGLVIASTVGIGIGLAVGWSRVLEATVAPLLWILYVTPKVALAPLIILWLGIGSPSQIALVFLLAVYPLMLNTIDGVKTIDVSLVRAGRVFGASGFSLFAKVILPATLPFVLVGLRRGVALGFIGAILGEFLGGSVGIGKTLQLAVFNFRLADALAIVVIMVLVTNVALKGIDLARHRLASWHTEGPASGR